MGNERPDSAISADESQRHRRRQVLGLDDFTAGDIAALKAARAPEAAKTFDHEAVSVDDPSPSVPHSVPDALHRAESTPPNPPRGCANSARAASCRKA